MYYRLIKVMSWCLNQCVTHVLLHLSAFMPFSCGIMLLFMFVGSAFWDSSQSHYNCLGMDVLQMWFFNWMLRAHIEWRVCVCL